MSLSASNPFATVTSGSVSVKRNLMADTRENIVSTLSSSNSYSILPFYNTITSGNITVKQNLIADVKENKLTAISITNSYSPSQFVSTPSMKAISPSISQISSTPSASDQLTKVQIWTIS
jgi:hypothetical protein